MDTPSPPNQQTSKLKRFSSPKKFHVASARPQTAALSRPRALNSSSRPALGRFIRSSKMPVDSFESLSDFQFCRCKTSNSRENAKRISSAQVRSFLCIHFFFAEHCTPTLSWLYLFRSGASSMDFANQLRTSFSKDLTQSIGSSRRLSYVARSRVQIA